MIKPFTWTQAHKKTVQRAQDAKRQARITARLDSFRRDVQVQLDLADIARLPMAHVLRRAYLNALRHEIRGIELKLI